MLLRGPRPLVCSICKGATTANFAAGAATPRDHFFVIRGAFLESGIYPRDLPGHPRHPLSSAIFHCFLVVPVGAKLLSSIF